MRRILFDANLPPALARGIHQLTEGRGIGADCILDIYKTTKIPDEKWIADLAKYDIVGVITQDYFDKTPQEIAAYQNSGVPFFYLAKAYNGFDLWKKCSLLLIKWPTICLQIETVKGYAEYEVPNDRGNQVRQLRRRRR
jgi:PIN like domain